MPGEVQSTGFAVDFEDRDVVASLVAAVQELACRIEVETARIISSRPFFADVGQFAVGANRKDPDAVVKSVARVNAGSFAVNLPFLSSNFQTKI